MSNFDIPHIEPLTITQDLEVAKISTYGHKKERCELYELIKYHTKGIGISRDRIENKDHLENEYNLEALMINHKYRHLDKLELVKLLIFRMCQNFMLQNTVIKLETIRNANQQII